MESIQGKLLRRLRLLTLVSGLAMAGPAAAQEAVVLSGGAARGVAHVGALLGMERLGYDPELVVGNSMGAIVGALYAAGYAPGDLWALVEATDWSDVFMPEPVVVGPDGTVRFPVLRVGIDPAAGELTRGFIPDWRVNRLLVRMLFDAAARARGDFDRLPRRYRAVAADMLDGSRVVLDRGDLALAVRASMAAPAFFSPVEWEGRLIADGGLVDYLPISAARASGARSIIAVDAAKPADRLGRTDPVALAGRAIALLMRNASPDTAADVTLRPDIGPDISGVQFEGLDELMRLGLEAAMRTLPPRPGGRPRREPPPPPDSLAGLEVVSRDAALARLTQRVFREVAPADYSAPAVLRVVDRLYATGLVNGVWPRVEARAAGGTGGERLVVRIDATPHITLNGAAGYEKDRGGRAWGRIAARTALASAPAEIGLGGSVTGLERWGALSLRRYSLFLPPLVTTLGAYYREEEVRLFTGDDPEELDVQRGGGWVGLEIPHAFPDWLASAVLHGERVDLPGTDDGFSWGPRVRFTHPRGAEPIVGVTSNAEGEMRFGQVAYGRMAAAGSIDAARGAWRGALVLEAAGVRGDAPPDVQPALGDRRRMPGLSWGQERGRGLVAGGLDLARRIPTGGNLRLRLRLGAAVQDPGRLTERAPWLSGIGLEALWGTPFGPLVLGAGAASTGDSRLEVSVGPFF